MSQDESKKFIKLYRELDTQVNNVIHGSDKLLSAIDNLLTLYCPKSLEEHHEFIHVMFELPNSGELLCDLQQFDIPDDGDLYNLIVPFKNSALDIVTHMIGADMLINDIINMHVEPHNGKKQIFLYLTTLESVSDSIRYMMIKLEKLYKEKRKQWLNLTEPDDDDEMFDSVLPGKLESFQCLKSMLVLSLTEYIDKHESERISEFLETLKNYFNSFANGDEPEKEFDFSFSQHGQQGTEYIDFHFGTEMIEVSSGGSVYDESVGSDSYTNWDYSIDLDGYDEFDSNCRFSAIRELVESEAILTIDSPEEYCDYENDDEDEYEDDE